MKFPNPFSFTMYRAVLYSLFVLLFSSLVLTLSGYFYFNIFEAVFSLIILVITGHLSSILLSRLFLSHPNIESHLISSLILFFLFSPASTSHEVFTLIVASTIATLSKYLLAINRTHIFNPVAIAAVLTPLLGFDGSIWWIATPSMTLPVAIITLYLVIHLKRQAQTLIFIFSFLTSLAVTGQFQLTNIFTLSSEIITSWPVIFFVGIMLTEPLTMPHTRNLQYLYFAIIGLLFSLKYSLGPIHSGPELALLIGNMFAYLTSNKQRYNIRLKKKSKLAPNIYQLDLIKPDKLVYTPGQYMEWTLPHHSSDDRGVRRYFTLSSSPTEPVVSLTFRVSDQSSSYKRALLAMREGDHISISHTSGDFTLPGSFKSPIVMIAGGIGITPFRSMIKYLIDNQIKTDIHLLYTSSHSQDLVFTDFFSKAKICGVKTSFFSKDKNTKITAETITGLPVYRSASYYISGPEGMVSKYKSLLRSLKISNIHTDYFPGF
jgi:glycine betaine catabolism B